MGPQPRKNQPCLRNAACAPQAKKKATPKEVALALRAYVTRWQRRHNAFAIRPFGDGILRIPRGPNLGT